MVLQVVGAGLGRTGTYSLMIALEQLLGGPCYHMTKVTDHPEHIKVWTDASIGHMPIWIDLFQEFQAAVDWPASAFWPEISAAFPDALVLHSVRDPESWWKSASNTIFANLGHRSPERQIMLDSMFKSRFTSRIQDRDAAIEAFVAHNASVRQLVTEQKLLEWRVEDGWEPICNALALSIPANPFPHANTTEEFIARRGSSIPPSPTR